jgi:hypothetical protein
MSWLLEGKKFAYYLSGALAMVWVSTSVFLAVKMNFPSLGFFTVLIGMILLAQFGWLYIEFHRSFFDPGLAWYQALPGAIPNLVCRLEKGDIQVNLRVSRIDRDGAFVFGKLTEEALFQPFFTLAQSNQLEAYFLFRNLSLRCAAIPVVLIQRGIGVGIQFVKTTSDSSKEIVDFVEVLRGEGYV